MRILRDDALLRELLTTQQIAAHFQAVPSDFRLLQYEKGEILNSPQKPLKDLLFVVRGKLQIYGIRADGSMFSVSTEERRAVLGDVEFCQDAHTTFYIEALESVLCVALPIGPHRAALEQDVTFLRFLLQTAVDKLAHIARVDLEPQTLEEQVLLFLRELQPDHVLDGIGPAVSRFRCSRRQLQRVVAKLCDEGTLQKQKKGVYRLTDALE